MTAPGRTTASGLGWRHQQERTRLMRALVPGTPCWWCGRGLYPSQALHADHSRPRSHGGSLADRLLHASCNSARGDGSRDDRRPALIGTATADGNPYDGRPWPRSRDW